MRGVARKKQDTGIILVATYCMCRFIANEQNCFRNFLKLCCCLPGREFYLSHPIHIHPEEKPESRRAPCMEQQLARYYELKEAQKKIEEELNDLRQKLLADFAET